ncbi:DUF397 domain-containing protein [Streptomyces bluensis]|uniref:DUF397 domain-containing protein n=1 Tax=Streptomyces bluensis TaxID=33897 RepID=UPI00331CB353
MHSLHWQKSTYSGDGSNCVHSARPPGTKRLRRRVALRRRSRSPFPWGPVVRTPT